MNNETETDTTETLAPTSPYGYDKLTKVELRKTIADLTKELLQLKADKKDYVGAANDAIKETDARVKDAVEALKYAEATGADVAHEERVADFLKAVPSSSN